jgi:mannose-6-phosphate isomerase-like protein (cupin superfamily)
MNRIATTLSIAAAFAAGCGVTHLLRPAIAAENITAQVIHTGDLEGDALSPASATGMRNKMFVSADGATVSIQDGNVPKHLHPNANEMQYILEGTGTIWLGDKEVRVKPGDLVIIPHGTAHGGTKPDGRPFKAIAIKTPPQTPDDIKLLTD